MLIGAGADKQKSLILTKCIYAAFKSDSVYTYFPRDTKETKLLLPHQGSVSTSFFPESLKICRQEIFPTSRLRQRSCGEQTCCQSETDGDLRARLFLCWVTVTHLSASTSPSVVLVHKPPSAAVTRVGNCLNLNDFDFRFWFQTILTSDSIKRQGQNSFAHS